MTTNRQSPFQGQMLAGTQAYGTVVGTSLPNRQSVLGGEGTEPAGETGNAYIPPVPTCTHYNEMKQLRCRAPQAQGTELCIGHIKQYAKRNSII